MAELVALNTMLPQIRSLADTEAKGMQMRQMRNAGRVADFEMQERQQALTDDRAARAAYSANPTDGKARLSALAGVSPKAYATEAKAQSDLAKAGADTRKTQIETAKAHVDLAGRAFGYVRNNPTLENALQALQWLGKNGVYEPDQIAEYTAQVQANPAAIKGLADQAFAASLDAKDQLMKIETRDLGGTVQTIGADPLSGKVTNLKTMAKTQSPDSIAQNETSRANNAATVGASYANARATREIAKATRESAGIQRDQATEMKLADDYRKQSKDFQAVGDAYRQISATLDKATTSPAATLAGATKFMKLLDPGSVVRESELGMALAATGVLDRATNYVETLKYGKVLTPNQVKDFKAITAQIYKAAQDGQKAIDGNYTRQAKAYGLRPEMVVQDLGQGTAAAGGDIHSQADAILKGGQ